jgi:hypothetical protein
MGPPPISGRRRGFDFPSRFAIRLHYPDFLLRRAYIEWNVLADG